MYLKKFQNPSQILTSRGASLDKNRLTSATVTKTITIGPGETEPLLFQFDKDISGPNTTIGCTPTTEFAIAFPELNLATVPKRKMENGSQPFMLSRRCINPGHDTGSTNSPTLPINRSSSLKAHHAWM